MIKQLNNDVIKYIAAGEVIDSPYSVVKELVENSIDANADFISVYLKDAGLKEIKVFDNGDGILDTDFYLIAKRYTTSKINTIEDLFNINTFGFRGEAIASISLMSKLEIISCHKNSIDRTAYRGVFNETTLISKEEYPHPQGTTVIVNDLFYNTPARKKFIKTNRTEIRNIMNLILRLNTIHPNIRFSIYSDDILLYSSYGNTNSETVLLSFLKKTNKLKDLLSVNYEEKDIKITGFISNNQFVAKRKNAQILSINSRLVDNPELKKAIEQGYRKYIPKNLYPVYYINIDIKKDLIDVNCHPRKEIVKYVNEDNLQILLTTLISSFYFHDIVEDKKEDNIFEKTEENNYNIIGQLKNSYIIVEYLENVYFIDQHALHERILLEEFKNSIKNKTLLSKELDKTVVLHLSQQQIDNYNSKTEILEQYGFELSPFGINDFLIRQVPYLIENNTEEEIKDIVENIIDNNKSDWLDILMVDLSCKSAIKINTEMTNEKIKEFVDYMIENKLTNCPHGRPIFFMMSFNEMNRKLRRNI